MLLRRALLFLLTTVLWLLPPQPETRAWGFFAHRSINRLAVFTLPPEMIGFYKSRIEYLTVQATRPDSRRTVVAGEAPRHFIDLDVYGDSAAYKLPRSYADAVARFGEDSLLRHGIVPWHVARMKGQLTEAFRTRDAERIISLSADLGHYLADACVPLHTTRNYNGQLTNQRGIHGLWESRLPELLATGYDFFTGPAPYLEYPTGTIWAVVARSNAAVDSVLRLESELTRQLPADRKYSYEERNGRTARVYSQEFSRQYHQRLAGQVERQMRLAVRLTGAFWYTCWVDAGQPDLNHLPRLTEAQMRQLALQAQQEQTAPATDTHGHTD
ncbi:zinc dependent phospholipase C family protein [Hymenobacter latericus]|uniref:zinc dependent phospholipase C family protein n=1 Tax=Hymenobacter sp. YIM 151858-1 TaxID=2987688 RepID=UPI002227D49D|nr:zinc dependent phospholipase C family protein [Hymenobacter sp. YIM 151858-1]UYZ58153.1 zinc dependent phospholipase C family protein [Hymenobacter sp. YIM 151858-1]